MLRLGLAIILVLSLIVEPLTPLVPPAGGSATLRLVLLVVGLVALATDGGAAADLPPRIGPDGFTVTSGVVRALPDQRLGIDVPEVRAVLRRMTAPTPTIRFHYLGPWAATKPLASGEIRRQVGVKLRAQDTCNVVYVMWHIEPDARIAVSIKRNPGRRSHAECGAQGYVNIRPRRSAVVAAVQPGSSHTLRTILQVDALTVWADGVLVWEGSLPPDLLDFDGPVGFRTDNVVVELEYSVGG